MAAVTPPKMDDGMPSVSGVLILAKMTETAEKMWRVYSGQGFHGDPYHPVEQSFRQWKWNMTITLIKNLLITQGENIKTIDQIIVAINKNLYLANSIFEAVVEGEKRIWLAFRHSLLKMKQATYEDAKVILSKSLEKKEINRCQFEEKRTCLINLLGAPQEDPFVEKSFNELF